MAYIPVSYFSGSPQFKLAIPQEAWYDEFITPMVGGNAMVAKEVCSVEGISRFITEKGNDINPILSVGTMNGKHLLFKISENEGISIEVTERYNRDLTNSDYYGFIKYIVTYYFYWTDFKSGTNTKIGGANHTYMVEYKDGTIENIPTYITCLVNHEERKCYLCYFCFEASNTPPNLLYPNVGNICNRSDVSGSIKFPTETDLYEAMYEYVNEPDNDPWSNAGYGDIGGGDGELDLSSDNIELPELPRSIMSTGFVQLYTPTFAQINELSDYMWGDGFFDNVLKLWNDPMDIILNLAQFPFRVESAGSQIVTAGNVVTNVSMNYPANQYVTIDCGSLDIKHFYNAYVDYEPYTTCEIFLPYIGFQELSMDEIMGKNVHVVYRVDLATGVCCAYISCDNAILYQFVGSCSSNIPVSAQSFQAMAQSLINVATSTVSAPEGSKGNAAMDASASALFNAKPGISRSGSVSSNAGIFGPQKPYLIFNVPRTCLPKGQNKYLGYPTYVTFKLGNLEGMTIIDEIILQNCTCTEDEKNEIVELLKGGVIL